MHSIEGLTQGGLLATTTHGITILPMIKNLNNEVPGVTQPWYTDDTRELGMFALIKAFYKFVKTTWPGTQLLSLTVKNSTDCASGES